MREPPPTVVHGCRVDERVVASERFRKQARVTMRMVYYSPPHERGIHVMQLAVCCHLWVKAEGYHPAELHSSYHDRHQSDWPHSGRFVCVASDKHLVQPMTSIL